MNKILHWVHAVDMRMKHDGLAALARKECKVNVQRLRPGEFVLFTNASWTQCAMYAANNCVIYHRNWDGSRLNAKALRLMPHFYDGTDIGYKRALANVIKNEFARQHPRLAAQQEDIVDIDYESI